MKDGMTLITAACIGVFALIPILVVAVVYDEMSWQKYRTAYHCELTGKERDEVRWEQDNDGFIWPHTLHYVQYLCDGSDADYHWRQEP